MTAGPRDPEVVVVGAGPKRAAPGWRAAGAFSWSSRAHFPWPKVCGGCLWRRRRALDGLLGERVRALGTPVARIGFYSNERRFVTASPGRCRIVARDVLDAALADAANAAGAHVRYGQRAKLLPATAERWAVRVGDETLAPDWIIWAAGLQPAFPVEESARPRRRLIGQATTIVPTPACPDVGEVAMHWLRGGYVGLATLGAAHCIVAWAVEADVLAGRRPWDALRTANEQAALLRELPVGAATSLLATAGFPARPPCSGRQNVLLVGDAAGFEEPFSGEGIGQALRSGLAAAEALGAAGAANVVQARYRALLRGHRRIRRRTRWLSAALRHPLTRGLLDSSLPIPTHVGRRLLARVHVKALD
ncbi:MAG: hypothetical protein H6816_15180 [Phycisphaerales bacterium]|nr:hypothetical protein [Phycisphaerales bacterium]